MKSFEVAIIGAGIPALTLSTLIAKQGHCVCVIEKSPKPEKSTRAFLLQPNGLQVMEQLGLLGFLRNKYSSLKVVKAVDKRQQEILEYNYELLNPPYNYFLTVVHEEIIQSLEQTALAVDVSILRGFNFKGFSRQEEKYEVILDSIDRREVKIRADIVVAADGKDSEVRRLTGIRYNKKNYPDAYLLSIGGNTVLPEGTACMHIDRGTYLGVFPIDSERTWILDYVQAKKFDSIRTLGISEYRSRLSRIAPEIMDLDPLSTWKDLVYAKPEGIKCERWISNGVVLLGDAAHTINPDLAQNLNLALENTVFLSRIIHKALTSKNHSDTILSEYEKRRRIINAYYREAEYSAMFFATHSPLMSWFGRRALRKLATDTLLLKETLQFTAGVSNKAPSFLNHIRLLGLFP